MIRQRRMVGKPAGDPLSRPRLVRLRFNADTRILFRGDYTEGRSNYPDAVGFVNYSATLSFILLRKTGNSFS